MAGKDSFAKLLLHCNGADNSTTFTDSSLVPKTITVGGGVKIDTAQFKFGGASAEYDGVVNTGYLQVPDSDDLNFGTGDFTIDFWIRFRALPAADKHMDLWSQSTDGNNYIRFHCYNDSANYSWRLSQFISSAQNIAIAKDSPGLSINTWYHIAYVRNGNNFLIFQGGTQCGTTAVDADALGDFTGTAKIGSIYDGGSNYFDGWLDEYRVSKGITRWTTTFTPPGREYGNTGGSFLFNFC